MKSPNFNLIGILLLLTSNRCKILINGRFCELQCVPNPIQQVIRGLIFWTRSQCGTEGLITDFLVNFSVSLGCWFFCTLKKTSQRKELNCSFIKPKLLDCPYPATCPVRLSPLPHFTFYNSYLF